MIFWEKLKIQGPGTTNNVAGLTLYTTANEPPVLAVETAKLKIYGGIDFNNQPITIPSGSSFSGSVTLPSGSSIANVLIKENSSYTLNVNNAAITSATITDATVSNASITDLSLSHPINLPAGSTVNGQRIPVSTEILGFFLCDGYFHEFNDWVSVQNSTNSTYFLACRLFKGDGTPYVVDGNVIQSADDVTINPGTKQEIINFADAWDDPFIPRYHGYVRFYYSTSTFDVNAAYAGLAANVYSFDISGEALNQADSGVYKTISNSTANTYIQTILYELEGQNCTALYQLPTSPTQDDINTLIGFGTTKGYNRFGFTTIVNSQYKFQWYNRNEVTTTLLSNLTSGIIWFTKVNE